MSFTKKGLEVLAGARIMIMIAFIVIFILIIADVVGGDGKISDLVKLIVAGIGSICTACLSLMYYQKDKDKELSLRYITGKRLDWINDTRKLTGDLWPI